MTRLRWIIAGTAYLAVVAPVLAAVLRAAAEGDRSDVGPGDVPRARRTP